MGIKGVKKGKLYIENYHEIVDKIVLENPHRVKILSSGNGEGFILAYSIFFFFWKGGG